jgi:hypothetical protein
MRYSRRPRFVIPAKLLFVIPAKPLFVIPAKPLFVIPAKPLFVIPAKPLFVSPAYAGIQVHALAWIPAFAGTTNGTRIRGNAGSVLTMNSRLRGTDEQVMTS